MLMTHKSQTSIIDEHISIKPVSEENYVILIFEIQIGSCKQMWEKTANKQTSWSAIKYL